MQRVLKPCKLLLGWTNVLITGRRQFADTAFATRPASSNSADNIMTKARRAENLGEYIGKIEGMVRKKSKISKQYFDLTLSALEGNQSNQNILALIRCFGQRAAADPPEVRIHYLNKVWDKLKSSGVKLDVVHYNLLLKVYLENEYRFSPSQVLEIMKKDGIKPNRITYGHLLSAFCREGDLSGASGILEEMKEESMSYNENIFHELILGHCIAQDLKGAEGVLKIMEEKNLDVDSATYTTYLCGLAKSGNIEKFESLLKECEEKEIVLQSEQLIDVICNLASIGHISRALDMIKARRPALRYSFNRLFYRLLNTKQYDLCFQISNILPFKQFGPEDYIENIICQFVAKSENVEKIRELVIDWERKGYGSDFLLTVLYYTLKNKELLQKSLGILKELQETGQPVKEIYFWPILASATREKTPREVLHLLSIMKNNYSQKFTKNLLTNIIFNNLSDEPHKEKILINGLHALGLPNSYIQETRVLSCMSKKRIDSIFELSEYLRSPADIMKAITIIVENPEAQSPARIVELLKNLITCVIRKGYSKEASDAVSSIDGMVDMKDTLQNTLDNTIKKLTKLLSKPHKDFMKEFLQEMLSQKLPISQEIGKVIKKKFNDPEITVEIDKLAELPPLDISIFRSKIFRRLPETHPEYEIGMQFSGYCRSNMIEEAEKLIKEYPGILDHFYDLFLIALRKSNNEEKFNEHLNKFATKIREEGGKGMVRSTFLLRELIQKGFLKEACIAMCEFRRIGGLNSAKAKELLEPVLENGSFEDIKTILVVPDGERPIIIAADIIKYYGMKGNYNKILEILENVEVDNVGKLLIKTLIAPAVNNEPTNGLLKKIINVLETKFQLPQVAKELIFAYACAGDIKKARECLDKVFIEKQNFAVCANFIKRHENRVRVLENLIDIFAGRTINNISQLYETLLENYVTMKMDPQKGLKLWKRMQEDNRVPSPLFLGCLARLLKANNIPVPFDQSSYEHQEWIFESDIPQELSGPMLEQYRTEGGNGILQFILRKIKTGHVTSDMIERMLEALERRVNEKDLKQILRYCLSLVRFKEAFDNAQLLQYAKTIESSDDPKVILRNIPNSFLIDCLMTEGFDRIPNEVAQIIMWACCHTVLNEKELGKMYEEKVQESARNRTIVEGVLKFASYLKIKNKVLRFLNSEGIFDEFGMKREVNFVLNLLRPTNRDIRIFDRVKSDEKGIAAANEKVVEKEVNASIESLDDGQVHEEVVLVEQTYAKANAGEMKIEEETKTKAVPANSGSV